MNLLDFNVEKIVIHQVHCRGMDGSKVAPTQSKKYINFERNAMHEFKVRVKEAIGEGSASVQMEIVSQGDNDLPSLVNKLTDENDEEFIISSYDIAKKLTDAQHRKTIPGGIVVIFSGTYGVESKKFLGIIKADIHSGYEKSTNEETNEISLNFVEEILLTPGTRLYKTAGFFEKKDFDGVSEDLNKKWVVTVSDYQINKAEGKVAACYFYSDFLGFDYPKTSARVTKLFYDSAHSFISKMIILEEEKSDLLNALTIYLKVDTSSTISSSDFAEKYLNDVDHQDGFINYMRDKGLPDNAFTKDIEHIKVKLKLRKVNFCSNVKIIAPSEAFIDLIRIKTIEGDLDDSGCPSEWTEVIIKDKVVKQE